MTKNPYLAAVASGLLLALSWPVYGFPLLLFVGFVPLLLAEKRIRLSGGKRRGLRVFVTGYITFFLWNIITTWWIWYSTVFGMLFAVLVNALLMALLFLFYHGMARRLPQKLQLVFLAALWLSFEKLHLIWDISWPWLNLGNAFSENIAWIQWYEYTGAFGGSLWVWIVTIGIFKTVAAWQTTKNRRAAARGIGKNVLMIALPVAISLILLNTYETPGEKVHVVVLQPNVDPYGEKYYTPNTETALKLFALADEKVTEKTRFIIAPETVFARNVQRKDFNDSGVKAAIKSYIEGHEKVNFLSGISFIDWITDRREITPQSNRYKEGVWYNDYNSAFLLNRTDSAQFYHKSKLVVGVENLPFKPVLEPLLGNVMIDLGGTVATKTTQKERGVFVSPDGQFKAAPVICYESVYGEFVSDYVKNGANFLAIITNDGWWGETQGHKQHLSYARLRAVETRRSIARSANTGISALISPQGELLATLPYNTEGALAGDIPINEKRTFYVRHGDYIPRVAVFIAGFLFLFGIARRKKAL